ncbi:hypothetical protein F4804DRAFT_349337 [Jackrogersella minutella]|nr:hypothetical protein F4804DRAFT_349337 [Jackrogersella minutella]
MMSSVEPRRTCTACLEPADNTRRLPCGCSYCWSCLFSFFDVNLKHKLTWPLKCCKIEVTEDDAAWVSPKIRELYHDTALKLKQKNQLYCAQPRCSALLDLAGNENENGDDKLACHKCGAKTCKKCKQAAEAHSKTGECKASVADTQLEMVAHTESWKPCPHCGNMVSRSHGCNRIRCICGHEFCYKCGINWQECGCTAQAARGNQLELPEEDVADEDQASDEENAPPIHSPSPWDYLYEPATDYEDLERRVFTGLGLALPVVPRATPRTFLPELRSLRTWGLPRPSNADAFTRNPYREPMPLTVPAPNTYDGSVGEQPVVPLSSRDPLAPHPLHHGFGRFASMQSAPMGDVDSAAPQHPPPHRAPKRPLGEQSEDSPPRKQPRLGPYTQAVQNRPSRVGNADLPSMPSEPAQDFAYNRQYFLRPQLWPLDDALRGYNLRRAAAVREAEERHRAPSRRHTLPYPYSPPRTRSQAPQ